LVLAGGACLPGAGWMSGLPAGEEFVAPANRVVPASNSIAINDIRNAGMDPSRWTEAAYMEQIAASVQYKIFPDKVQSVFHFSAIFFRPIFYHE
jgi:hypothetical protein